MAVEAELENFINKRAIDWDPEIGFTEAQEEQLRDPYSFPRPVTSEFGDIGILADFLFFGSTFI